MLALRPTVHRTLSAGERARGKVERHQHDVQRTDCHRIDMLGDGDLEPDTPPIGDRAGVRHAGQTLDFIQRYTIVLTPSNTTDGD